MKRNQQFSRRLRTALAGLGAGALAGFAGLSAQAQIQWIDADVGGPTPAGSATVNADNSVTIVGGGSDIWNNSSQFNYYYAWASGNTWTITAQIENFTGPDDWSKVELLVDLADPIAGPQGGDPFIAMMDTQSSTVTAPDGSGAGVNNGGIDQYRTAANGPADWRQAGTTPAVVYPIWFQIARTNSAFSLNTSPDGVTWTTYLTIDTATKAVIGQDNGTTFGTAWPNLVAVGIAVTGHNQGYSPAAAATVANLTATFPAAVPPTAVGFTQNLPATLSNALGCEGSLTCVATNNAQPSQSIAPITYQWYKNGGAINGATNSSYTWLLDATDNGASYKCQAGATGYPSLTANSATTTVTVTTPVYHNNGIKVEFFANLPNSPIGRQSVEAGNVPAANSIWVDAGMDDPGNLGNNYVTRVSGWFMPPTTDSYVFFISSDDDSDLFLSTDATKGNKQLIAQETGWAPMDNWLGGGSGSASQQRSDQWAPTGGIAPYPNGISLVAGNSYYIELVHWQGGGGDSFGATYQTETQMADPNWANEFTNGIPSIIEGTNGVIKYATRAPTVLTWVQQPTNTTATIGLAGTFYAAAATDGELGVKYTWYKNGTVVAGANGGAYSIPSVASSDSGDQIVVVATTYDGEMSITSSPAATLNVAAPVQERGYAKMEYWYNPDPGFGPFTQNVTNASTGAISVQLVSSYATPANYVLYEPTFEGNSGANAPADYTSRLTALFYPPTTGLYVFYVNSDDPGDLFVSTDSTPGHAVLVAQETGWSNPWQWTSANGGSATTKCSTSWTAPDGSTPWAGGIQMTANQPYYVALIHQDTGGGNNCEATFTAYGAPAPVQGIPSAMTGNLISTPVTRSFSVAFTQDPTNYSVAFGGLAMFNAAGISDSLAHISDEGNPVNEWTNPANYVTFQWTVNGKVVAGANGGTFSFGPVSPLDNGAQIVCQMRSLGYVNNSLVDIWSNSPPVTLTVTGNAVYEPGFALHEYWSANPGRGAVEANTAGNPTWYMASPAFDVDVGTTEVADNFTDELVGFFIPPTSGNYTFYGNSDDDSDLFVSTGSSAAFRVLVAQEAGWSPGLNWSAANGGTASQVNSSTYVAPNGTTPFANGIAMVAGQKYFIQQVHHQGGGGTWNGATETAAGAATPNPGTPSVIRGALLGSYVPACTYVTVTNNPLSVTVPNYTSATFTAGGATDSVVPVGPETDWRNSFNNFLFFQWYKNGAAVAGANGSSLTLTDVLPSDNGSTIVCTMRALGYANAQGAALWATSSVAILNVITGAPPTLNYSAIYTNYANQNFQSSSYLPVIYVDVVFSGAMDPTALLNVNNYVFSAGSGLSAANITSITVNSNTFSQVELALNASPNGAFTVTVNSGMRAQGGGPVLVAPYVRPVDNVPLTCLDLGTFGTASTLTGNDPAIPSTVYNNGPGAYTVQCEGSDIWNNNDGFNFLYEAKSGNFDVVVRQIDTTHVSNWTKGGLMIRETLDQYSRDWNIINDPRAADGIQAIDGSGYGANTVECNFRGSYGGGSASFEQVGPAVPPTYPNAWVRLTLQRSTNGAVVQDLVTAYNSTNGTTWVQLGQIDASTNGEGGALLDPIYVGICTTAHDNDAVGGVAGQYIDNADYANYTSAYSATLPTLVITRSGTSNVSISWTPGGGTLLSSPAISGASVDWQPVGTANPAVIAVGAAPQYFRVQVAN